MNNINPSRRGFLGKLGSLGGGTFGAYASSNVGALWFANSSHANQAHHANSAEQFKIDFAQAVKNDATLKPMAGISSDVQCAALQIEGKLPEQLTGRFYRNGPALFERARQRYQHWFAGDGMVQQFTFTGQSVSHKGRFVQTEKFKKEQQAQQFLLPAFGSTITSRERITGPDSMNTANTNALEHGGKLLALWEGGSAIAMNPNTMKTEGPITWQKGWEQMPFSAHPKIDPQGNLWNIGGAFGQMISYHVKPNGELAKAQVAKLPIDTKRTGGMIHDMAVTQRFLVVPIPPVVIDWGKLSQGAIGKEVMTVTADEPLRFWVAPKDDIAQARMFELPSEMIFHVGNAFERGDEIWMTYAGGVNSNFLGASAVDIMRGKHTSAEESMLKQVRLNMRTGQAKVEILNTDPMEFPRVSNAKIGIENKLILSPVSWKASAATDPSFQFDGIQLLELNTGKTDRYDYTNRFMPEEHVLVSKNTGNADKSGNEKNAWVIGTAYDLKTDRTCLNVFEAQSLASGPIARAWLPYAIPLGFHGNFHE
jgi:all-trans-8'-apo-beta-carotenal 15,15'-oxygenase